MRPNPVLDRELRERMRGGRAFVALTAYLVVLLLVTWMAHESTQGQEQGFGFDVSATTAAGRQVFDWVLFVMLLLVLFLVPGLTAGAIAGERERQTLSTLQVTLLRPHQILWGKVTSSLAFVVFLVVASAPLLAVAYRLGGISLAQAARGLAGVVIVALLLAVMIVAVSAMVRRVQTATVLASAVAFLLAIGSFVAFGVVSVLGDGDAEPPAWILAPNALVLVADLATDGGDDGAPLAGIERFVEDARRDEQFGDGPFVDGLGEPDGGAPFWLLSTLTLGLLAGGLFLAGVRRLRTPAASER